MKILSIETSADETGVSLIEATGDFPHATYEVLGNALASQIKEHTKWGGIVPSIAKREHAKYAPMLLESVLEEAEIEPVPAELTEDQKQEIEVLLEREPGLAAALFDLYEQYGRIEVDLIAVTSGPGLEPALWVGVNFARALALLWDTKIVPINHMEGHILASVFDSDRDDQLSDIAFPAISLLVSGGHTELVRMDTWGHYDKIGQTRDDAVGEAFDKVARLLGLPYPGGPEVAARAKRARQENIPEYAPLPRPMLDSGDLDFSFSGLKTAVRYAVQDKELSEDEVATVCRDFEDAAVAVLIKKTCAAISESGASTLIVGGGVSANQHLKYEMNKKLLEQFPDVESYFPQPGLSTDNSVMIALSGHARAAGALSAEGGSLIKAEGRKAL